MGSKIIILFLLILMGFAAVYYFYPIITAPTEPILPVACTTEAKLCPDGTSVGRTGPKCEFSECPTVQIKENVTTSLNQEIFNNGVFITPLEVISDSRCPADVVCVWAGEVSLKVMFKKGTVGKEMVVKSQTPVLFENYKITLTDVIPENNSKETLDKADYRFTFLVTSLATAATGTVSGRVTLSPICPVERIPPEPQCSPKPYATTIHIREEGKATVIKTIQSDNLGAFTTDLPAGSYELDALTVNDAILPRCTKEIVMVKSGQTSVKDISCDTGIR